MGRTFAPYIATRIIKELTYSYDYDEPLQSHPGSLIYSLPSKNPEAIQKDYSINSADDFCTCLKQIYRGWPCRHLFKIWRTTGQDLANKTISFTHQHWRLILPPNIVDTTSNPASVQPNLTGMIIVSPSRALPLELKNVQINYTPKKSTKKRQRNTPKPQDKYPDPKLKEAKKSEANLFPFIRINSNSCAYDCVLALLYFLHKEFPDAMRSVAPRKGLARVFQKIDNQAFVEAQNDFIKYARMNGHQNVLGNFTSVTDLLVKVLGSNFKSFWTVFEKKNSCTNKNCKYTSNENQFTRSVIKDYSIEDIRDVGRGVLKNFFLRYMVNYADSSDCACNESHGKNKQRNSEQHQFTTEEKLINLPTNLLICLEDLFTYDNNLQNENNKHGNIEGILREGISDRLAIEDELTFEVNDVIIDAQLKSVIYFQNSNHYTLAYKGAYYNNSGFKGWCFYDDMSPLNEDAFVTAFPDFSLDLQNLIQERKVPIALLYVLRQR